MLFNNKSIIRLDSVDSTNNYAAKLLSLSHLPEGSVITALEQTEGRGQRGTVWNAHKGKNLLCSIVLYPKIIQFENQFTLSQAISLAAREFIADVSGLETFVKWPNDIVAMNKKVAGILIEASWSGNKLQQCIVGIGINLNQEHFEDKHAGSLKGLSQESFDLDMCLRKVVDSVEKYYEKLQSGHVSDIQQEYRLHLFNFDKEAEYIYQNNRIKARIVGIDAAGKLKLRMDNTQEILCGLKEIAFCWSD